MSLSTARITLSILKTLVAVVVMVTAAAEIYCRSLYVRDFARCFTGIL